MPPFAASQPALSALVAIDVCPGGLRLSALARVLGTSVSTMQRAVDLLGRDDLVSKVAHRFRTTDLPRTRVSVPFAMAYLPAETLVRALAACPAVELAGLDAEGALLVTRRFPEPLDEASLHRALATARGARPGLAIDVIAHHEVAERLFVDETLGERLRSVRPVRGEVGRLFPAGSPRGRGAGAALGRLNPLVTAPDGRAVRRFAKAHSLTRIVAFGSAVRDDLIPTSDVDLLVERAPGPGPGLLEVSAMTAEASELFGRDVDIVIAPVRDPGLRSAIEREGVVLVDAR